MICFVDESLLHFLHFLFFIQSLMFVAVKHHEDSVGSVCSVCCSTYSEPAHSYTDRWSVLC